MDDNKSNAKEVSVDIKTSILQDDDRQDFTFHESGNLVKVGDNLYLRFKEHQNGKEVAAVTLKITDEHVQLTRQDNVGHHSRLVFEKNKDHETVYQTPYGPLKIEVRTKQLSFGYQESSQNGDLNIDYDLYSGDMMVGEYNITLHFSA